MRPPTASASSAFEGAYVAARAAALAGVPKSTVYDWARKEVIVPSISPVRERLWSFADLLGLRIVSWLRRTKATPSHTIPATPMQKVRQALEQLHAQGREPWTFSYTDGTTATPIWVDPTGAIHLELDSELRNLKGQQILGRGFLDLLGPFDMDGVRGPHLVLPRPHLRIVPGKLAGQPHIAQSRLSTLAIAALASKGMSLDTIQSLYPSMPLEVILEAISLEDQLRANVAA